MAVYPCNFLDIVLHYKNKTLYNKVCFGTNFTDMLMNSRVHRAHPQ